MSDDKRLTTAAGIPVPDNQTSLTAGERGPTLLQDHYLIEKLAHFNRERTSASPRAPQATGDLW